ncbi:hypothetical protein [Rhodopirellula sallentina]|uniref:Membrane protein n=1 Tax=Rhodopirellula sallentina SM41 TaxID=1263870 RepID=M5U9L1_9BACT|nr:hypothetical protein [Rhodopirellula sallentina]EMI54541.1 membrane protein [Rhodopirellula sallentina SM41]
MDQFQMKSSLNFGAPLFLGAALTLVAMTILGAAAPQEANDGHDAQIVPIAGGMVLMLAVNDREEDRLYIYEMEGEKTGDQIKLKGSIDLSATGKELLPKNALLSDEAAKSDEPDAG